MAFIITQGQEYVAAFNNIIKTPTPQQQPAARLNQWKPPPLGWIKLNTDGASKGNPGLATGGGVFRDALGSWCLGFYQKSGACNAITTEMWAIWRGLRLAWQKKYTQLVVESDSQLAVRYLTEGVTRDNSLFPLVTNCKELIRRIGLVELKYCNRESNRLADRLASIAFETQDELLVLDEPPDCCTSLLDEECRTTSSCNSVFD